MTEGWPDLALGMCSMSLVLAPDIEIESVAIQLFRTSRHIYVSQENS